MGHKRYGLQYLLHHLEDVSEDSIQKTENLNSKQYKFIKTWRGSSRNQRNAVLSEIKSSLLNNAKPYTFTNWQRAIKYEYSLHPLCTIGSTKFIGGRFNYGEDIHSDYRAFNCLYVAEDKKTSIFEALGQDINNPSNKHGIKDLELALKKPDSTSFICLNGYLDKVIDLTDLHSLNDFLNIIKKFKQPKQMDTWATNAHFDPKDHKLITNIKQLIDTLLMNEWREQVVTFDCPSNSQEFGELVLLSGISGIVYPSKFDKHKKCLAIFPDNFDNSDSYIEISDQVPDGVEVQKLDKHNYQLSSCSYKDLIGNASSSNTTIA